MGEERAVSLDRRYVRSADYLARDIQGQTVLIPLSGGIGVRDEPAYSLNPTGAAVWRALDGGSTLGEVAGALAAGYDGERAAIERDVLALVTQLVARGMVHGADA